MSPARFGCSLFLSLALPLIAAAQVTTYTWTGAAATIAQHSGSADVANPANWAGGQTPTPSATSTALQFGASAGLTSSGMLQLWIPSEFSAVQGLSFTGPMPVYQIISTTSPGLGSGGLTVNGGTVFFNTNVTLLDHQTWNIGGAAYVYGTIDDDDSGYGITKTGDGYLVLDNPYSTFSGGIDVQAGSLFIGSSSVGGEGSIVSSGPIGTGILVLRDGTELRTNTYSSVSLHNPIRLGTNVTFGHEDERNGIDLYGDITPLNAATTLVLGAEEAVFINGSISDAVSGRTETPTTMTFTTPGYADSLGFAVLTGQNTYSGGTIADRAAVIFYSPGSIPASGSIAAINGGYISTGYNSDAPGANGVGGMTTILQRISDPAAFNGSLGFDTDPDNSEGPTIFNDTLNLSAFAPDSSPTAGFWGIGTQTSAIITGQITPPTGGNYVFGGGEGTLYVQSDLGNPAVTDGNGTAAPAPTGVRVRSVSGDTPLSVWLQGNNSFNGHLMSDHSVVVLDSAGALPTGSLFGLDSQAYVGYTENTGYTPAQFLSKLQIPSYNATSVLGFDSATPAGRTISELIDLSAFGDIYIGSTTHAHLAGPIRAPSSGTLSLAGIKGGWLTIDSALTPTVVISDATLSGVTSLQIGVGGGSDTFARGIVELTSGESTFAGGTTLRRGYTLVGASSTGVAGAPESGPLGTGVITFDNGGYFPPALVAGSVSTTLHNPIVFSNYSSAQFGVGSPGQDLDDNDPTYKLSDYVNNGFVLHGNLSGNAGWIGFTSGFNRLYGDNSGLNAGVIQIGQVSYSDGYPVEASTLLMADSNSALGNTHSSILIAPGADLAFNSPLPSIGSISGGDTSHFESSNRSHLTLLPDSTLTIHQHYDGELGANIGGTTEGFNWNGNTTVAVTASVVKTGLGELVLSGQSRYSGGTTVQAGTLTLDGDAVFSEANQLIAGPAGTGTVTLAGGQLSLRNGTTLSNPLQFSGSGNVLGGNGTFDVAITSGAGVTIAPGNSPGALEFAAGLTWAPGGTYSVDILSLTGTPGVDSDLIAITGGTFDITATAQNPFTIQLNSLASLSQFGPLGELPSSPVSLVIVQSYATITGIGANFENFFLSTSNFTSPGTFELALGGPNNSQLLLNYTPGVEVVPEPSTYALIGLGLLAILGSAWRKKHRA